MRSASASFSSIAVATARIRSASSAWTASKRSGTSSAHATTARMCSWMEPNGFLARRRAMGLLVGTVLDLAAGGLYAA